MSTNKKECDGCGNIHYEIDLYESCYNRSVMLCDDCTSEFIAEQESGRVYDAITGEE